LYGKGITEGRFSLCENHLQNLGVIIPGKRRKGNENNIIQALH